MRLGTAEVLNVWFWFTGLSDIGDRGKTVIYLTACQMIMINICLHFNRNPHGVYSLLANSGFTYDKVQICEESYNRDV